MASPPGIQGPVEGHNSRATFKVLERFLDGRNTAIWTNTGPFNVQWYNPRLGGDLVNGTITKIHGPGKVSIGKYKSDREKDWVVLIRK
jgi:hypothetical protein